MTGTGITLRQLLLDEDGKTAFMKGVTAPYADAVKGLGTTTEMRRLHAQLSLVAQAGAKAFLAADLANQNVGIAVAMRSLPKMQLPNMAFVQFLANNPAFQVQQRNLIAGVIAGNVAPGMNVAAATIRAGIAAGAAAKLTEEAQPAGRTYGSLERTPREIAVIFFWLWPFLDTQMKGDTETRLIESFLLALCLTVLISCTAAALP